MYFLDSPYVQYLKERGSWLVSVSVEYGEGIEMVPKAAGKCCGLNVRVRPKFMY